MFTLTLQKDARTDPSGTLEKACSLPAVGRRNLSNAKHHDTPTLLDLTFGEVHYDPFHVN